MAGPNPFYDNLYGTLPQQQSDRVEPENGWVNDNSSHPRYGGLGGLPTAREHVGPFNSEGISRGRYLDLFNVTGYYGEGVGGVRAQSQTLVAIIEQTECTSLEHFASPSKVQQ